MEDNRRTRLPHATSPAPRNPTFGHHFNYPDFPDGGLCRAARQGKPDDCTDIPAEDTTPATSSSAISSTKTVASASGAVASNPLPARAQRLPALRPRQEHLPEFRPLPSDLRRRLPPAFRRHPTPPRKSRNTSMRSSRPYQWWASTGPTISTSRRIISTRCTPWLSIPISVGQGLCRIPVGRGDACLPRHPVGARQDSPYRNRSVRRAWELFQRMKRGAFPDGTTSLRAKIDMASPNMNLRDRPSTASATPPTTAPATAGASPIVLAPSRTPSRTR